MSRHFETKTCVYSNVSYNVDRREFHEICSEIKGKIDTQLAASCAQIKVDFPVFLDCTQVRCVKMILQAFPKVRDLSVTGSGLSFQVEHESSKQTEDDGI